MKKNLLFFTCFFLGAISSFSQFSYQASSFAISSGSYTDLGTNGTAITTNSSGGAMTYDDDNSSIQNIGFNFVYNGTTFTQFVLNSNGFIKLGNTAPAVSLYYQGTQATTGDVISSSESNVIYPFNHDLMGATSPEYRVFVTGTAPNRICTIQFKNVTDYTQTSYTVPQQYSSINFQIKLYETTNVIDFVYGTFTSSGLTATFKTAAVGIKGGDIATSVNVTKASATAWNAATALVGNYTGNTFNNRNSALPTAGLVYRFTPIVLPANDASVVFVNTLGKLPLGGIGSGHQVQATIQNAGSAAITNLAVTLNISGANTFTNTKTISTLAVGAAVNVVFDAFYPAAVGTNTVVVSVPTDAVTTNNSYTFSQVVANNGFGYPNAAVATTNLGYNTGSGLLLSRHSFSKAATINGVRAHITAGGNTVFGVICDATGAILAQSSDRALTSTDSLSWVTFNFPTPVSVAANTNFFIGIGQRAGAYGFFPLGTQSESPTRTDAYATAALAGGTPTYTSSFGRFMIEGVIPTVTPVVFTEFKGYQNKNNNILSWSTISETNNSSFDIERSIDGTTFSAIGSVASKATNGNSNNSLSYEFADNKPFAGANYYRLKQVDKDGKSSYSQIVLLKSTKTGISLVALYPNPAKDKLNMTLSATATEKISLVIYDVTGKAVIQKAYTVNAGDITISETIAHLKAGNYLVKLIDDKGNAIEVKSLVKQ